MDGMTVAPCPPHLDIQTERQMSDHYEIGDRARWNWGGDTATGEITGRFTDRVTRTIKGTEVTRNASDGNPAYMIEQEDGDRVLKAHSELERT